METRVIVADSARARIFVSHKSVSQLQEVEGFAHAEAHLSESELVSDAPGRSRNPHGSLDPATSARDHEAENFARLLARHLKELHNQRHYEELILIASPRFLGVLRNQLPGPLDRLVTRTVDKDLTTASIEQIIDHIKA